MESLKFALLGHPVSHSLSPAIHQSAYRHHGLKHDYQTVDCPDAEAVAQQVQKVRRGELAGVNVTTPWKRTALELADSVDASAADTGAANVLLKSGGRVVAHNTDARALARLLRAGRDGDPCRAALVIGNGGAALASVVASRMAGASEVYVTARKWTAESPEADWPRAAEFRQLGALPCEWSTGPATQLASIAKSCDLIVQSTSGGMTGCGDGRNVAAVVPWASLPAGAFAYDVVYTPAWTPFLDAAEAHGIRHEGGLSMLIGQAALSIELWLKIEPPLEAMTKVAEKALFGTFPQESPE